MILKVNKASTIRHLLSRAGFGFTPEQYQLYLDMDYEQVVDSLLDFSADNSALDEMLTQQSFDFANPDDIKRWWLFRMLFTRHPLQEKLTLFWHGHFATSVKKVRNPYAMYLQNRVMRQYGLGRFDDLLLAVARDPAMILWLDNEQNRKGKPNENFAREVMELFTLGIGHYTESDVKEAARAFTGWHTKQGRFYFDKGTHDNGAKSVLGESGNLDGVDIVRILARRKETAERLALKLIRFFCVDNPDGGYVDKVARAYEPDHQIKPMLKTIFMSEQFQSKRCFHALIKSPCDYVVGTLKYLQVSQVDGNTCNYLAAMGQDLFAPPSVKGWDGGAAWLASDTMMARFNFAAKVIGQKMDQLPQGKAALALCQKQGIDNAASMVDYFCTLLLDGDIPSSARAKLVDYVSTDLKGNRLDSLPDTRLLDAKIRGLLHLIMTLPTYQLV